jgi:8-oxo-dGTP pyrophosphatase MutT (NUDIX family)
MEIDRIEPGAKFNDGPEPTHPRQAATVIVLRGAAEGLEVLLVQRHPDQRFMGGAWVFPGGAVDADEAQQGDLAHRLAGVREVEEEVGVRLGDPASLVPFSRWITPAVMKIRFDTRFFLARAPEGAEPRIDNRECVAYPWFTPAGALAAFDAGELLLVFPTIKTLQGLAGFETVDELLRWAEGREVVAIEPEIVVEGEVARVVLPGDPGAAA